MPLMFPACKSVLFRRMCHAGEKERQTYSFFRTGKIKCSGIFLSYFSGWGAFFRMFCTLFCTTLMGRA